MVGQLNKMGETTKIPEASRCFYNKSMWQQGRDDGIQMPPLSSLSNTHIRSVEDIKRVVKRERRLLRFLSVMVPPFPSLTTT